MRKSQSAMEYLMTYGWAILIIAVVLGALFQLGVFNAGAFAPRAPPGACQVFRPDGIGSTSFINLEGVCSGELPQYVASFVSSSGSDMNTINLPGAPTGSSPRSMTFWIYFPYLQVIGVYGYGECGTALDAFTMWTGSNTLCPDLWDSNNQCGGGTNFQEQVGSWEFVASIYNATNSNLYGFAGYGGQLYSFVAGSAQTATTVGPVSSTYPFALGTRCGTGGSFTGYMANVQLYNATLTNAETQALYNEGIGGAPLKLQNLVGWWPLNGNANDYSGNNDNLQTIAISYTSQWSNGYTPP